MSGCFGFFFGSGYSCHDTHYFAEPPVVVKNGEEYSLRWHYGSMTFYFEPRYKVKNGALWFSLQGTSSSGAVAGREANMLIEGKNDIEALKQGGAFWWSRDSLVPLAIIVETK